MKPDAVQEFYRRLQAHDPHPETELKYVNPYTLLVAVALSAQATDVGVNKATGPLFQVVDTPEKMLALGEAGLKNYIKTIGLFNTKAKNVMAAAKILVEEHGGQVPRDRDALEKLPGVGRKTANVVLNVAFGEHTIAVDTHIFRVGNRTGSAPGKNPLQVELKLEKVTPAEFKQHAHHWLILHGRYICKARVPECWRCVVADLCAYKPKTPPPGDMTKTAAKERAEKKLAKKETQKKSQAQTGAKPQARIKREIKAAAPKSPRGPSRPKPQRSKPSARRATGSRPPTAQRSRNRR
jgi:endonuclease-3